MRGRGAVRPPAPCCAAPGGCDGGAAASVAVAALELALHTAAPPRSVAALARARAVAAPLASALVVQLLSAAASPQAFRVLLLGIGQPAVGAAARFQLALSLELAETLAVVAPFGSAAPLAVHDPALCAEDVALLSQAGCRLLGAAEAAAAHAVDDCALLVVMPHCPRELYEAVLRANWRAVALRRLYLLGNSFAAYAERDSGGLVARAAAFCAETLLLPLVDNVSDWPATALNDTVLMTFAPESATVADGSS